MTFQPENVNQAAQNLAAKMGGAAPSSESTKPSSPDAPIKPRKDYGFKGYWDDAIYGCLFRIFAFAIGFALLRFVAPAHAVQLGGCGGAVGLWIFLRVRDCNKPFGLTNWAISIYIAATIHDTFWNLSQP